MCNPPPNPGINKLMVYCHKQLYRVRFIIDKTS